MKLKSVIATIRNRLGSVEDPRRELYLKGSLLGKDSENPWIRKSATIEGWLYEGEPELLWEMATQSREGQILEIGSWMGKSACILAGACREFAPETRLFCVDPFSMSGTARDLVFYREIFSREMTSTFEKFCANAERLEFRDFVIPVATLSGQALPFFKTTLRLAFIDGAHDYLNAKRDAELVLPLIQKGGFIAFHDVHSEAYPDLQQLMTELGERADLKFYKSAGTMVAFQKN